MRVSSFFTKTVILQDNIQQQHQPGLHQDQLDQQLPLRKRQFTLHQQADQHPLDTPQVIIHNPHHYIHSRQTDRHRQRNQDRLKLTQHDHLAHLIPLDRDHQISVFNHLQPSLPRLILTYSFLETICRSSSSPILSPLPQAVRATTWNRLATTHHNISSNYNGNNKVSKAIRTLNFSGNHSNNMP